MREDEKIRFGLRNYFILTKFTIGQVTAVHSKVCNFSGMSTKEFLLM